MMLILLQPIKTYTRLVSNTRSSEPHLTTNPLVVLPPVTFDYFLIILFLPMKIECDYSRNHVKKDETKHKLYKPDYENLQVLRFISKKLSIR